MTTDTITWSSTIYSTPDTWGSYTVYGDAESMAETIASLIDAGGEDWAEISLDDCTKYRLVETIGDAAIYRETHRRDDNYITVRMGGDMEPIVEDFFSDLDEARESLS